MERPSDLSQAVAIIHIAPRIQRAPYNATDTRATGSTQIYQT